MTRSPSHALVQYDPGQTVYALLRERARKRSLLHLVTEAALATAAGLAIVLLRPHWWAFYLPFAIVACYSIWGLLDRATRANPGDPLHSQGRRVLLSQHTAISGEWLVAAAGTLGALVLFFLVTGYLLGNWIH